MTNDEGSTFSHRLQQQPSCSSASHTSVWLQPWARWMSRRSVFVLWVCLYRVQVAACALCPYHDSGPDSPECLLMNSPREQRNLGFSGGNPSERWRPVWISCLDFSTAVTCHISSAQERERERELKHWSSFGAHSRRPTNLYLAGSGCIVLIFLWPLSASL